MKDLKGAIALALTCKNAKLSLGMGAVCFVGGVLLLLFVPENAFLGGILLVYFPLFLTQFVLQQEVANVAGASPMKRTLSVTIPNFLSALGAIALMIVVVVTDYIRPGRSAFVGLEAYLFSSVFLIYMGAVYKKYLLSLITMILMLIGLGIVIALIPANSVIYENRATIHIIGCSAEVISWFIQVLLRNLLYKSPLSAYMYKSLERQMR